MIAFPVTKAGGLGRLPSEEKREHCKGRLEHLGQVIFISPKGTDWKLPKGQGEWSAISSEMIFVIIAENDDNHSDSYVCTGPGMPRAVGVLFLSPLFKQQK